MNNEIFANHIFKFGDIADTAPEVSPPVAPSPRSPETAPAWVASKLAEEYNATPDESEPNDRIESLRRRFGKRTIALCAIGATMLAGIIPFAKQEYDAAQMPNEGQYSSLPVSLESTDPLACIALSNTFDVNVLIHGKNKNDKTTYVAADKQGQVPERSQTMSVEVYLRDTGKFVSQEEVDGRTTIVVDRSKVGQEADMDIDNTACNSATPEVDAVESLKGNLMASSEISSEELARAESYVTETGKNNGVYLAMAKAGSNLAVLNAIKTGEYENKKVTCAGDDISLMSDTYIAQEVVLKWAKQNGMTIANIEGSGSLTTSMLGDNKTKQDSNEVDLKFINDYQDPADMYANKYFDEGRQEAMAKIMTVSMLDGDPTNPQPRLNCNIQGVK